MRTPPIELKGFSVKEISLRVNPDYNPEKHGGMPKDEGFQFMHYAQKIKKREWVVVLGVKLDEPVEDSDCQVPYFYKLEMMGYFSVHPKFPGPNVVNGKTVKLTPKESDELIKNRVELNGPAMLYGIAREKIRSLSASSAFPEVLIPTVAFSRQSGSQTLPSKKQRSSPKKKK
jgi:hypothetical protein